MDSELIEELKKEHRGLRWGVDVVRTRRGPDEKVQYRIHWEGRLNAEDSWVAERYMSPELVERHRPKKKTRRRRR